MVLNYFVWFGCVVISSSISNKQHQDPKSPDIPNHQKYMFCNSLRFLIKFCIHKHRFLPAFSGEPPRLDNFLLPI